ncbi:hypothetical protein RvY_08435 [Ramazzottius varieornatus]|uniref:Uncharacterized protein n=1 Tax=Ramazzottius varieornatus TaxID=947166 RepID=A0A1D1V5R7_RAMVA|nr:hypothetical protein RvY_08435 [Ramazzottius varieornatus]
MKNQRLKDLTVDIVIPHSEIAEKYVSDTDFGALVPRLPPTMIVNPADIEIDESEDEPEESDTWKADFDGDDMDFFTGD